MRRGDWQMGGNGNNDLIEMEPNRISDKEGWGEVKYKSGGREMGDSREEAESSSCYLPE